MVLVMLKNIKNIIWRKKHKISKRIKKITQEPKPTENPNIVDIKSVNIKHPKTSRKFCKAMREAEVVSQVTGAGKHSDSLFHSETKKGKIFWIKKLQK